MRQRSPNGWIITPEVVTGLVACAVLSRPRESLGKRSAADSVYRSRKLSVQGKRSLLLGAGLRDILNREQRDDITLIELICRGDADALSELYDRYHRLVFSLALQVVQDRATAEEVTLDVFTRVWRRGETYRAERARVSTWLTTITRNRAIDRVRRRQVRPEHQSVRWVEGNLQHLDGPPNPAEAAELTIRRQQVRQALTQLPPDQREALALAYFRGYSHRQIAEALDQPLGTVKTRIRLAMQKLRRLLSDDRHT